MNSPRRQPGRPLYDRAGARRIDAETMGPFGMPGPALMEQAGRAVAAAAARMAPAGPVAVVAAAGNNGGDGYVAARWLHHWEVPVRVIACRSPDELDGDARWAFELWQRVGGTVTELPGAAADRRAALAGALAGARVVVDAMFGTGIRGALRPPADADAAVLNEARAAGARILAVDLPSGVDATDGTVAGAAVEADLTVTMGFDKLALRSWPGAGFSGAVEVVDLGYPTAVTGAVVPAASLLDPADLARPRRAADGHKGSFGTVGAMAGSHGMPGAAALTALGALRAGAGKAVVCSEAGGHALLAAEAIRTGGRESWEAMGADGVRAGLAGADVVACGPGLGRGEAMVDLVRAFVADAAVPLVLDADALYALAGPEAPRPTAATVWTPHPGEAARLLDTDAATVQAGRVEAVRRLADATGGVVVLKGAGTLIAEGDRLAVSPWSDARLAVPGSGDVLTGIIAALVAQGLTAWEAACTGVWLHGAAARQLAGAGNLAGEIADGVAAVLGGCGPEGGPGSP